VFSSSLMSEFSLDMAANDVRPDCELLDADAGALPARICRMFCWNCLEN
jgi:hypothetical protein